MEKMLAVFIIETTLLMVTGGYTVWSLLGKLEQKLERGKEPEWKMITLKK